MPESGDQSAYQEESFQDSSPIEPTEKKTGKINLFRWIFFLVVILYALLSYFHTPILTHLGKYLIVSHSPAKSDLIVCLSGGNVERGLAAADAYNQGFAEQIFIAKEVLPDGYRLLREKGLNYPDSLDLFLMIVEGLGVPRSAVLTSELPVESTLEEAEVIKKFVTEKGLGSFMIITSPTHTRRAWLTFRKFFKESDVRILMVPSRYSEFNPEDWWKKRKYVREVIIEYQKLIFYALKYFW